MQVKVTRVYLSEDSPLLNELFDFLQKEELQGATIFRGVKGFRKSGKMREARFLDMRLDLPMVIEFFDLPEKVDTILELFKDKIPPGHVLQWIAEVK
ncbi:Uncharacterized ACR, COG1993 (plasmid) [Legionella adelaidensis]|jgi:PII-like signaling protein|uniref:Uncharacterized ACR, COG1993 n=1 Tax=Legionella adelaidensis TaxID=45056 RepID=A0A0W0R5Y8_9GAMM|nr:DUF190 domain-containing protein [Legionella adelaidensis]KTC66513.1 hypothetical protein Lade_1171 [Legionella adelaidensis]VEH85790.1 Uncharacterized ACR, COG1993 [Legionella adelaidensis]